jgi:hypothetical protein
LQAREKARLNWAQRQSTEMARVVIHEKSTNKNKKPFQKTIDIKGGPLETAWSFWYAIAL